MHILVVTSVADDFDRRVHQITAEATVDHARRDSREYEDALQCAEIILGRPPVEDVSRAPELRWLQLASAGANRYVGRIPKHIILTNASGVYGIPAAEHVFALMLGVTRSIPSFVRRQNEGRWDSDGTILELYGSTCGILGLGDIGMAVASRAKAFGMRVLAFRRNASDTPVGVDVVFGLEQLDTMLAQCDFVVNTLPETEATRRLLDRPRIRSIKKGAVVVNIGRGTTMDEAAFVEALQDGYFAGAGLDVFEEEPLPEDSPLWEMPNVIVTPHVGGVSPREPERFTELVLENLRRYTEGRPLKNRVDPDLGY